MKKFLYKILFFAIIAYPVLFVIQFLFDSGLRSLKHNGTYGTWNLIFDGDMNIDVAVLGNSRAMVHINPVTIESVTGMKSYNMGMDGTGLFLQRTMWLSYIKNNTQPKYVIQNIDLLAMGRNHQLFEKFQYIPYYQHDDVFSLIKEIDPRVKIEKIVPLLKYQGALVLYQKVFQSRANEKKKGFLGHDLEWKDYHTVFATQVKENRIKDVPFKITNNESLRMLIDDCKERGIHLIFVYTPIYYEMTQILTQQEEFVSYFTQLANEDEDIEFWDYSLMPNLSYDRQYFYNATHLNYKGAAILSDSVAHRLKLFIEENNLGSNR